MLKKLLLFILVSTLSVASFAQFSPISAEKVYKDWQVLANSDSKNMVEIFYCVVKCDGINKVQLMVFNDGTGDREVDISLEIKNTAGDQGISVKKKFLAQKGIFHKATCDSDKFSELKITLPDSYDPLGISVKQTL